MSDLSDLTGRLNQKHDLAEEEASGAARALASADHPNSEKEAFLVALAEKGETADEVAGFARTFRSLARDPEVSEWAHRAIDVCGTGGDKIGTFNISTAVMFVLAAGGVPVFKHGNRSITSKCGSAELLAALGVPLEAETAVLQKSLQELNFAFFFAPAFHPAFKAIMPVRQALAGRGQRTIFNILGPLINPGRPAHQLLGVFSAEWMPRMASALDAMEMKNGFVVHCRLEDGRGLDELSCAGANRVCGFGRSRGREEEWDPAEVGLQPAPLEDLLGGDIGRNLAIFEDLLENRAPRGLTETVLLNAAGGFYVAGEVGSLREGLELARELLAGGVVKSLAEKTRDFFRE